MNRAFVNSPMSTKKVHRSKKRFNQNFNRIFKDTNKVKRKMSFFRGLVFGIGSTSMLTTELSITTLFLLTLNIIIISYSFDAKSESVRDKLRPKKIHFK
ncbi:hypothetical protein IR073_06620 [Gemella sp. 19428wG2_WT2a]|nr:hypothetical protein [Gemella sp. 19428wG2_WT2a]TFU57708.1 hypothetical protein E4T67_06545 [Gemella sp. WT2a]